jgi:putative ABC transport system substrate-binding protein
VTLRRRAFITLLGGAAAGWPFGACAQQTGIPVVGILASSAPFDPGNLTEFRKGLSDAGYVEGRNVALLVRAPERYDQLPALAADLVRQRIAVIVAAALPAALAAKTATATIPIVFFAGDDPVGAGLVTSLSRPSGNLTGVTSQELLLSPKRLGLLREVVPTAGVFGVLVNGENPNAQRRLSVLEEGARSIGQRITVLEATREEDFESAFATAVQQRVVALLIIDDNFFATRVERLATLAISHRLPAIAFNRAFATAGGLISYEAVPGQIYPQIGIYVGRILKGERPSNLPVVLATKFELVINLKTAKTLGLEISPGLLSVADDLIE